MGIVGFPPARLPASGGNGVTRMNGRERLSVIFWFLLLVSIPLSFRYFLGQFISSFQEYEAVFLYGSDILVLGLIMFGSPLLTQTTQILPRALRWFLSLFIILVWVSVLLAPIPLLALYNALRLTSLLAVALIAAQLFKIEWVKQRSLQLVATLSALEGLWAIFQFKLQHAMGLYYLGESPLSVFDPGTAKIVLESGKLMRSAGSFLHANVLGAFLVIGFITTLFLLLQADKKLYTNAYDRALSVGINARRFFSRRVLYERWLLVVGLFFTITGLVLTFSRQSWIAALIAVVLLFAFSLRDLKSVVRVLVILLVIGAVMLLSLGWAILPRAQFSSSEPSVSHRVLYNQIGIEMLAQQPLGAGAGNQVYVAVKSSAYQEQGLTLAWQWQPIHNLYLLVAVELGIVGGLSFLIILATLLVRVIRARGSLILSLLVAVLILGLFDHYFWTLQQGRLLFWVVMALALAVSTRAKPLSFNG